MENIVDNRPAGITLVGLLFIIFRAALGGQVLEAGSCTSNPRAIEDTLNEAVGESRVGGTRGPFPGARSLIPGRPRPRGLGQSSQSVLPEGERSQVVSEIHHELNSINLDESPVEVRNIVQDFKDNPQLLNELIDRIQTLVGGLAESNYYEE